MNKTNYNVDDVVRAARKAAADFVAENSEYEVDIEHCVRTSMQTIGVPGVNERLHIWMRLRDRVISKMLGESVLHSTAPLSDVIDTQLRAMATAFDGHREAER